MAKLSRELSHKTKQWANAHYHKTQKGSAMQRDLMLLDMMQPI